MKDFLYRVIELIALVHDSIIQFSRRFPSTLSDKQLHFLICGLFGLLLFALVYPLIRALVRRGRSFTLSFLLSFLLVMLFAFAVEVGQLVTGTGRLEVADITAGIMGFLCLGGALALLWGAAALIRACRRRRRGRNSDRQ